MPTLDEIVADAEARQAAGDLEGARRVWADLASAAEDAGQDQVQVHATFHAAALDHALGRLDDALRGYRWVLARPADPTWRERIGPWYGPYAAVAAIRAVAVRALRPGPDLVALLDELDWVEPRAEARLKPALLETRGQLLYQLGQYAAAHEAFGAAAAARRADPDTAGSSVAALLLRQAMSARDTGDRAAAEALLIDAASAAVTATDRVNAVLLRAELLITRHALGAAAGLLDAVAPAVAEVPVDEVRLRWEVARATCAAAQDDLPRAMGLAMTWDRARLAHQPPHVAGWVCNARCAVENAASRHVEAVASARAALGYEDATRAPESRAQALESALDALVGARDLATANALAGEARELCDVVSPDKRARLHLAIGRVALERGDVDGALRAIDAANLPDPPPEVELGRLDLTCRARAGQGDWAAAVAAAVEWERVVDLPPAVRTHGHAALRCAIAEAHLRDQAGMPRVGPAAVPPNVRGDASEARPAWDALLAAADERDARAGGRHFHEHALAHHVVLRDLLARLPR